MFKNITLPRGYKLGDYRLERKISSGGFSVVYLGYCSEKKPVAIKEFFPSGLHLRSKGVFINFINAQEKLRFLHGLKGFKEEAEIVMHLKHKNIIEIVDFFECNGTAYLVMPYEYGTTLNKYIAGQKNLSQLDIVSIIIDIFQAIEMFHKNNIIHLDLKPANIWIRPNREALILDFGTARSLLDAEKLKKQPMFTPGYAAPEQHKEFFHPNRVGVWTDYYGLGATMFSLLNKEPPQPSNDLLKMDMQALLKPDREGQYHQRLIYLTEKLMNPDWKVRKTINLNQIIDELKLIKEEKRPVLFTEALQLK